MRRCVSFHGQFRLKTEFRITYLLFSGYTLSLAGRVPGEQWGGAVEILSRIGANHGH